jgi:putative aminopeptidase FrvX
MMDEIGKAVETISNGLKSGELDINNIGDFFHEWLNAVADNKEE